MIISFILFIVGLGLLIKGAGYLVDGASSLAKKIGVSTLVIGLTVVAFGTSMPELIVNIFASVKGAADIAVGDIIGSNIFNILFILGVTAVFFPLIVKKDTVRKEIPLALLAVILVAIMANDKIIDGGTFSALTRIDGWVLISFFAIFLYYVFGISKVGAGSNADVKIYSMSVSFLMIVGGSVGLIVGGKLIIDAAVVIARILGVSEALIGLTIVAAGTSLPELATSAVAAYKKNPDIAVGNIVGSNIFNVFFILGISALIRPLPLSPVLNSDFLVAIFATFLLFIFMFIGKRRILKRWQGAVFVFIYVIYIAHLVIRG
ncbi:MAG: calcium/sodium antiporter [Parcubacteria group bacterium]